MKSTPADKIGVVAPHCQNSINGGGGAHDSFNFNAPDVNKANQLRGLAIKGWRSMHPKTGGMG
jgi:hypothetical protein